MTDVHVPNLDHPALPVMDDLSRLYQAQGHQLALTGGATRDFLLGRRPRDFDLVSDATPEQTEQILTKWAGNATRSLNRFGVVTATFDKLEANGATRLPDVAIGGQYFEVKYKGPDDVVVDVSEHGWVGAKGIESTPEPTTAAR